MTKQNKQLMQVYEIMTKSFNEADESNDLRLN